MDQLELFQRLGLALALGLLIGAERGWHERTSREGARIAGVRTFGITGLLGGLWALLAENLGAVVLGFAFLAFAVVMITARVRVVDLTKDYGATTVVASLLTFALGAVAVRGDMGVAAAGSVVTALLLGVKPVVHRWLTRIAYDELLAVFKLLAMSVVLLPVLPNKGYGPWQALNPYEMWLMVVLISAISFIGYAAVRLTGEERGIPLAALAGGLVASTAVTISFSRLVKHNPRRRFLLAAGIVLAATTMFPRIAFVAGVIEPALLPSIAWPLGLATTAGCLGGALLWRKQAQESGSAPIELRNPFEFGMALKFGALLAAIMLLTRGMQVWLGEPGIYLLAGLSGSADVDAITLSLSRMAGDGLSLRVAAIGIVVASLTNTAVKAGIAASIGGREFAWPVGLPLGGCMLAGLLGLAFV